MFSKADKRKAQNNAVRAAPSLISTDLEIAGNLNTPGEVQLDGKVEGDVICGKLVIGEKASIAGQIEADEVVVRGRVAGRIKAKDVRLAKTAHVNGDIWHDSLAIEAGAFLDGHCKRNDAAPVAEAVSDPASRRSSTAAARVATASARKTEVAAARGAATQDDGAETVAKTAARN
ncbi:MAG: polymer-forming cytoskeletal protein [Alphaproteobacteria bacterium]|jgi:cytoskeletal protein CcmA (bactofilin family)|nr:polymer-forming cytoskeletal protein [Alphaproteobacteria bacterium]MDP6830359.1 polymer-forming cytoskeletal protein [Alphaproteobacteria bacterium]MDP6872831.1 polymer-forming cytoskeletal protein [Alphaproteobacteria bacterium]